MGENGIDAARCHKPLSLRIQAKRDNGINYSEYIIIKHHQFMQEQNWRVSFRDFESGNVSFLQEINHYFGNVKGKTIQK